MYDFIEWFKESIIIIGIVVVVGVIIKVFDLWCIEIQYVILLLIGIAALVYFVLDHQAGGIIRPLENRIEELERENEQLEEENTELKKLVRLYGR